MAPASWQSLRFLTAAIVLAIMSQIVSPSMRTLGASGFVVAGLILVWGLWPQRYSNAVRIGQLPSEVPVISNRGVRIAYLVVAAFLLVAAYSALGGNAFTTRGVVCWTGGFFCFVMAVWEREPKNPGLAVAPKDDKRGLRFSWQGLALVAVILLAVFFRFYNLDVTPIEMTSDHAEKLCDVNDVLNGQRPIFFPRNTGRESFQFYLTALLIHFTPLQVGHLALKVGTGMFGVLAIPFTFLLGRELYNRHVGLLAAALLAMGHWHVAITRVGLRFPFTAAFATPALYFLFRAFRLNRRRDWILVGVFLGVGLHTYIPMRIVPLLLVTLCGFKLGFDWMEHRRGRTPRPTSLQVGFWLNAVIGATTSAILFLPLFRFMMDEPRMFWMRATSRAAPENLSLMSILEIFLDNVKDAALMFNFIGDVVAVNTIGRSPVLGWVTGALFFLGLWYLLLTMVRDRDRRPVYLLIMLFMLLLPSTLSIQFPMENPSVVRTGGAPPVVMIIAALPFYWWVVVAHRTGKSLSPFMGRLLPGTGLAVVLMACFAYNYHWYFVRYHDQIFGAIGNSRDLGGVLREWVDRGGTLPNAYVVGYPHWVDTRLVAIHAGEIEWHNTVWKLETLVKRHNPDDAKLFFLNPDDSDGLLDLQRLYPHGRWEINPSSVPGRDKEFVVFEVLARRDPPDGLPTR